MQLLTDFRAKEGLLRRAEERHKGELAARNEARRKISKTAPEEIPLRLTRSKRSPFSRDKRFFCDGSESRGKAYLLFPVLLLPSPYVPQFWKRLAPGKLGTSLDTSDEQDSGIRYHKVCLVNNVTNVQCKPDPGTTSNNDSSTSEKTAQTEFLAMAEIN